jgi:leucine dehydrogenase
MLRALGIFIHGLGGRFIASPDLGTTSRDMEVIAKETQFVTGVYRGPEPADDYNAITARGVLLGMKAAAKVAFGSAALKGRKIAIQGLGKVGSALMELLLAEGAELFVTDIFFERVKVAKDKNPSCIMVPPEEALDLPVDILAPCAMGDLFSPASIERLKCKIIAGAATHQLAHEDVAGLLQERGVIFVPDFLLNAGDIIMVNAEIYGIPREQCRVSIEKVYGLVENLLLKAKTKKQIPYVVAKEWALERMKSIRTLKKLYRPRLER